MPHAESITFQLTKVPLASYPYAHAHVRLFLNLMVRKIERQIDFLKPSHRGHEDTSQAVPIHPHDRKFVLQSLIQVQVCRRSSEFHSNRTPIPPLEAPQKERKSFRRRSCYCFVCLCHTSYSASVISPGQWCFQRRVYRSMSETQGKLV